MPINKPFTKATEERVKANVPEKVGVYELKAFGEPKYVESSKNL